MSWPQARDTVRVPDGLATAPRVVIERHAAMAGCRRSPQTKVTVATSPRSARAASFTKCAPELADHPDFE